MRRALRPPGAGARRRAGDRGAADGVDHRQVLFQKRIASDDGDLRLVLLRQDPSGLFQRLRSHVVGRSVDQVAGEENAIGKTARAGGIGPLRNRKAQLALVLLAVARIDIAAEQQAERGGIGIVKCPLQPPVAIRQGAGKLSCLQGRKTASLLAKAKQRAGNGAALAGQDQHFPRLALEAVLLRPGHGVLAEIDCLQPALGNQMDRPRAGEISFDEFDCHRHFLPGISPPGIGGLNDPLGLTEYFSTGKAANSRGGRVGVWP